MKKSQTPAPTVATRVPTTLTPPQSTHSTPINNVTPVSSRGPSLSAEAVHLRTTTPGKPSTVFQEIRNSLNRNTGESDKELSKIQARLDKLESTLSKVDEINHKLDLLLALYEKQQGSKNGEVLEAVNKIRQRLGC